MTGRKRGALLAGAVLLLLFIAVIWLLPPGTSVDDEASPADGDRRDDYFSFLRAAQKQVRGSDSHLAYQYERLIERGDVEGLIAYLRSNFVVVPGGDNKGWARATSDRRWGSYAALRGGLATPRELADLLHDGLARMGVQSSVVAIRPEAPLRSFDVPSSSTRLSLDLEALGGDYAQRSLAAPVSPPDSELFWQRVAATIPDDVRKVAAFDNATDKLPTVQITDGDVTRLANLWAEDDAPYVQAPATHAGSGSPTPRVTVKLEVAMADQPGNAITLASGSWPTEEIGGAQIVAGFAPGAASAAALFTTPPRQFTSFVPVLRLAGPRFENDEGATITGPPFTILGQVLENDGDDWLPASGAVRHTGNADEIQSLEIKRASSARYPWIGLDIAALNAAGQPVPGVPIDSFAVSVDESPAPAILESNTGDKPGILFLLDVSDSVAEEFRGAAASELVRTVAREVRESMPAARFRVGIVSGSGASLLSWRNEIEELDRDVRNFGMGSPLWRAAAKAAQASASLVVFITDGHAGDREGTLDAPDIASERAIRAGPPFIMVGAVKHGEAPGPAVSTITELSGGASVPMGDTEQVTAAILDSAREHLTPYRIWVRADSDSETHAITVSLPDRDIAAATNIVAPPAATRSELPGPVGLYLTVTANGVVSQRTLAGHPYRSPGPVSESAARDTLLGLFGEYTLFAEAGTPNAAQILDDLITSRLSWQPVVEAVDEDAAIAAVGKTWRLPRSAFTFNAPLPGASGNADGDRIIDYGLRWWLHARQRVERSGVEHLRESVDVLPNTRFFSTNEDPVAAFARTIRASSFLTDLEDMFYASSAPDHLGADELSFAGRNALPAAPAEKKREFARLTSGWSYPYQFVVPASGDASAGIAVDVTTGTTLGLLRVSGSENKGAGITEAEVNERFDQIDRLLSAVGDTGGAPAAWAKLEQAKMDRLRFATILIVRMEPPDLLGMLRDEACEAASGAVGAAADAGIRVAGGSAAGTVLDAIGEFSDASETLGLGGLESPVSIPGCE